MSTGIVIAPTWQPRQGLKLRRVQINAPAPKVQPALQAGVPAVNITQNENREK